MANLKGTMLLGRVRRVGIVGIFEKLRANMRWRIRQCCEEVQGKCGIFLSRLIDDYTMHEFTLLVIISGIIFNDWRSLSGFNQ